MLSYELLNNLNEALLNVSRKHPSCAILHPDLLELLVIFQEEFKVVEGNIDLQISSILLVLFLGSSSATKCVLLDLVLDLFRSISHEDT